MEKEHPATTGTIGPAEAADGKRRIPSIVHDAQVSSLINLAARLTNKAARMRLGPVGAWPGQIPLLMWMMAEEGLTQKDLVERSSIEQSTVAEHLVRMERDGLIYRVRDSEDGRRYRLYLTDRAKRIAADLLEELESGARQFTRGIGAEDLRIFHDVIRRIIENLDDYISTRG
jgi:DNA-binding MarR family transcriptional regulator